MGLFTETPVSFPANTLAPNNAPIGACRIQENADGTPYWLMQVQNLTPAALTVNQPYVLRFSGAVSGNLTVAVATTATTGVLNNLGFGAYNATTVSGAWSQAYVVVAHDAIPTSGTGYVCVKGYHDVLVDGSGTSIAVGDTLRIAPVTSSVALIQDQAVSGLGPFTRPPRAVAIANAAASAAATTIRGFFFGEQVYIAP